MRSGLLHVPARMAATMIAGLLIVSCSSDPTASETASSGGAVPTSDTASGAASAAPATAAGGSSTGLPEDLFTAPPKPLDLAPVLASEGAVTKLVGLEGGEVSATGPDGTRYTLEIPRDDLLVPTEIVLTPYAEIGGLPFGAQDLHSVGVELEPDGLQLAIPATLTITPSTTLPEAGIATMSTLGHGHDATLVLSGRDGAAITIAVPHLSGWLAAFPVLDAELTAMMLEWRVEASREFEATAFLLQSLARARQLTAGENPLPPEDLLDNLIEMYDRDVLEPELLLAASGCAPAQRGLATYVSYDRTLQLAGIKDNAVLYAKYARPIPDELLKLVVTLCFKAAYDDCVKTGDFPRLMGYYYYFFSRNNATLGLDPKPEDEALARDYLTRCGRWRVKIATTLVDHQKLLRYVHHMESTAEFHVQWTPGSGPAGITASTIEGFGPTEVTKLERTAEQCTAGFQFSDAKSSAPATGKIDNLTFESSEVPTIPGEPIPSVPKELRLTIGLGLVEFGLKCNGANRADKATVTEYFLAAYQLALESTGLDVDHKDLIFVGGSTLTFRQNWQFRVEPFKATTVVDGSVADEYRNTTDVRLEVTVEHDPR